MPEISLTTPIPRTSESKIKVRRLDITQQQATIELSVQDSGNAEIRYYSVVVPDPDHATASINGIFTALDTARSGETGGVLARANYRILGYLADEGYFAAHTLVP